ncbi:universal stress protein [Streptomyces tibetensis]|uniref:Universal stress protein n=1 Tax=Streptomyces tibetensis TaxID=2382123 RepID=A0ABW6N2K4_9ACTN
MVLGLGHPGEFEERDEADNRAVGLKSRTHAITPNPIWLVKPIALAEATKAQLVILGIRRRPATLKVLLGRHAQGITLDEPCPVITGKEPSKAAAS